MLRLIHDPAPPRQTPSHRRMNCPRCATPIPDSSQFCLACGANLATAETVGNTLATSVDGAAELMRMLRAETAGDFEIEHEIGRGGMAAVYLATDIHLHRKVAIKVLPPELTFGPGAIERFRREARTAAALDHPNIIPIYRVSATGRIFWYAMKYIEGETLQARLDHQAQFSLEETIGVLEVVADALDYAHARGIVHRDIKPSNIIVDPRGWLTIMDFGIAKEVAAGPLTGSGSWIGSPTHMSPEQCTDGEVSGQSDQYAVGVLTYQLLSGLLPVDARTLPDLLYKHRYERPVPLDTLRPGLPTTLYAAVDRALAKHARERFGTVRDFVEALKDGTGAIGTLSGTHATPRPITPALAVAVAREPSDEMLQSTAIIPRQPSLRVRNAAIVMGIVVLAATGITLWSQAGARLGIPSSGDSTAGTAPPDSIVAGAAAISTQPAPPSQTPLGPAPEAPANARVATPPAVFVAGAGRELSRIEQWVKRRDRAAVRRVFGEAETDRIWAAIAGHAAIAATTRLVDASAPDSSARFSLTVRDARGGAALVSRRYTATFVPVPGGVRLFTVTPGAPK